MTNELELYVIKEIKFIKNDSPLDNIVLKFISQGNEQRITHFQVFIATQCIDDSETFNFANIYYDMFNVNKTIEREIDIVDMFTMYLSVSGNWKMKKSKPKFNQEQGKVSAYPYLNFTRFDNKLKKQWFEKQYKYNNIKIGEYINE